MLDRITRFFSERLQDTDADGKRDVDVLALASAALMFEVSRADRSIDDEERARLRSALQESFALQAEDLDELEALAEREVEEATDLYQFTRLVTEHFDVDQRITLIEQLWSVAWADGHIDDLEDHTIRRIAGLIHVRHSDFVAARLRTRPN